MDDLDDEQTWLQYHVMRLRMALRYTRARQSEALLKEMITDAEARLEALADARLKQPTKQGEL